MEDGRLVRPDFGLKLMIASDLHGSAYYTRMMEEKFEKSGAARLILLGDLLYHGPRNPLPEQYDPPKVAEILNGLRDRILCVRGNCDSEVDQMVLNFPIQADYAVFYDVGTMVFATHGHVYNENALPNLSAGDILLHGHTHIPEARAVGDITYLNPGSLSLPKAGWPGSYMLYEDGTFRILDLDDRELKRHTIAAA